MNGLRVAVQLFRTPGIGPFLAGRAVAATGIWMERIALGWLMWEATGSAGWVGALAFARLIPTALFGPWGGVLADRAGAIRVLQAAYAATGALAVLIAAIVLAGMAGPTALLVLGTVSGALQALANGPMKSALSDVAPRHLLATAVPVGSVTFNAAAFVGPALAGVTIAAFGAAPVFLAVAATAMLFFAILSRLPRTAPEPSPRETALNAFTDAGRIAARHPLIGPLLLLHLAFALLMRPIVELLPAVAGVLLDGGPATLGLLTSAMGVGAFAGSLWLTWRSGSPGLLRPVLGAAAAACIAALLLAASRTDLEAALCFAGFGGALVVRAAGGNTVVQLEVEDRYRGRVMAIWGTILRLGAALGGLVLGLAADAFGMRAVIAAAALLALASIVPVARLLRRKRL